MNKYYNINNLFDENGEPVKVTIKIKRKYNYIDYKTAYETTLDSNKFLSEKYNELQKQKDAVVEYIKKHFQDEGTGIVCKYVGDKCCEVNENFIDELLRMLGEIDVED